MIRFDEWFLPDGETHLQEWMRKNNRRVKGRLTYQFEKFEAAMRFVPTRRVAIDVGAHVGLWTYWIARNFQRVHAFEPSAVHRQCWMKNMVDSGENTTLYPMALGDREGRVNLHTGPSSSGDTHVVLADEGDVVMQTLDSFNFTNVDFLKVDVEGFEYHVLKGAEETLTRERPIVVVEQKGHEHKYFGAPPQQALAYLQTLGMAPMTKPISGDFIMGWPRGAR